MSVKKIFVQFIPWPLALIYWVVQSNLLIDYVTQSYLFDNLTELPNAEVGLVLGSSKNGKHGINPYFKYRLEAAAELYFSGKVKKLLVSGDNHISTYDETSDMANYLLEAGVPNEDIIRDYAGFRTLDSVVRAKKVFNCTSLIIVSQHFHNQRAVFIALFHGINAVGYNAQDVTSKSNVTHVRDFFAKFSTLIDLFLLNRQPKFL